MAIPVEVPPLNRLIDATVQWHRIFASDRLRAHMSPGFEDVIECFVGECRMVRWGLLSTEEKIGEVWDLVMPGTVIIAENPPPPNDNIIDYVVNGAAYVTTYSGLSQAKLDETIATIVEGLTWPYRAQYIADELKERVAEPEFLEPVFSNTGWALFMYLLSISPLEFKDEPLNFGPTSSTGDT